MPTIARPPSLAANERAARRRCRWRSRLPQRHAPTTSPRQDATVPRSEAALDRRRHGHRTRPADFTAHADPDHHGERDGEQIERTINATDSEDALKYLPSLLVRKRYIGDYNHAILSSRASGTGNSARSAGLCRRHPAVQLLGNGVGGLSFRRAGAW